MSVLPVAARLAECREIAQELLAAEVEVAKRRNELQRAMRAAVADGVTLRALAEVSGVSMQRVHQVVGVQKRAAKKGKR